MTPLTPLPLDSILQGDCLQLLPTLPERSVDLVFADPPYNLQLQQELYRPNRTKVDAVDDDWDRFSDFAAYDEFTRDWLSACRRVMKDTATLWVIGSYHNIYRVGAILMDMGFWILNDIVWVKTNPMPNFRGVRFTNAHETLLWAKKSRSQRRYTFNHHAMKALNEDRPLQMRSDWHLPLCNGNERLKRNGEKLHPTQKPEELIYRVLAASTHPGDLVLDPFSGTGTTAAVAKKLGRRFIGMEREPDYADESRKRLETVKVVEEEALKVSLSKRALPRISFGSLVARGWIHPGECLYFNGKEELSARIMADGTLKFGEFQGSIHAAGTKAGNTTACNGWEHWFYRDEAEIMIPIDSLRERARAEPAVEDSSESTDTVYSKP